MSDTQAFWAGEFGDSYTERNRVNWSKRTPFWEKIIERTAATAVLEVGCNAGWNLRAIREVNPQILMSGIDVNHKALEEAVAVGLDVEECDATRIIEKFGAGCCDLAFTAGCLIHVHPVEINQVMAQISQATSRFVLAIEYEAEKETEVNYRRHSDRLWRRPYGEMYKRLGFDLIETGALGPDDGFGEGCTWWLLEAQT